MLASTRANAPLRAANALRRADVAEPRPRPGPARPAPARASRARPGDAAGGRGAGTPEADGDAVCFGTARASSRTWARWAARAPGEVAPSGSGAGGWWPSPASSTARSSSSTRRGEQHVGVGAGAPRRRRGDRPSAGASSVQPATATAVSAAAPPSVARRVTVRTTGPTTGPTRGRGVGGTGRSLATARPGSAEEAERRGSAQETVNASSWNRLSPRCISTSNVAPRWARLVVAEAAVGVVRVARRDVDLRLARRRLSSTFLTVSLPHVDPGEVDVPARLLALAAATSRTPCTPALSRRARSARPARGRRWCAARSPTAP